MSAEANSVAKLTRRVANIPELIARTLDQAVDAAAPSLRSGTFVVTGAGIAAGPARFFATHLRHDHGLAARYCPPSAFARADTRPKASTLIVFSQGLSANARMVLTHTAHYEHVTLITATRPDAQGTLSERLLTALLSDGVEVVTHDPKREDGMLVRVLGPTAAALQGVRWARSFGDVATLRRTLSGLVIAVQAALDRVDELRDDIAPECFFGDVAFLTLGGYEDACRGLSWKWMEGLWVSEPPIWDLLQAVHGPLQTFWEREMTLVGLVDSGPLSRALLDRLEKVLHPERHRLVRLYANLPGSLAMFEHGVALDRMMTWALESCPRDLSQWPAKGVDEPLYGLSVPITLVDEG